MRKPRKPETKGHDAGVLRLAACVTGDPSFLPVTDSDREELLRIAREGFEAFRDSVVVEFRRNPPAPSEIAPVWERYAAAASPGSASFAVLATSLEAGGSLENAGAAELVEGPVETGSGGCFARWRHHPENGVPPPGVVMVQRKSDGKVVGAARFAKEDDEWFVELEEGLFADLSGLSGDEFVLVVTR